jgi:hypothetical protein
MGRKERCWPKAFSRIECGVRKKVISPEQRRWTARAVVASELCSGRAACRFLKVSRSTYWYPSREPTGQEQRLLKRLRELSEKHARHGYRRIAALLRQEGWPVGKRHVQRLRRSIGLREPPTKRKVVRPGISTGLPTKAEHRAMSGAGTSSRMPLREAELCAC